MLLPCRGVVAGTQLDEVAGPIVLAWQLGRRDAATLRHVKAAADYIAGHGPQTPQERWENQGGDSPATIDAEIAGLVCAADLARAQGDSASRARYLGVADAWRSQVKGWTVTSNGPYGPQPYFLFFLRVVALLSPGCRGTRRGRGCGASSLLTVRRRSGRARRRCP